MSGKRQVDRTSLLHSISADIALSLLAVLLIVVLVSSLRWRMVHDSPIMMYMGFLMDRFGAVPYRDFFDMNMPGTYVVYLSIGRLFGYGDTGFRIADLILLSIILSITTALMKRFGQRTAWASVVMFGLLYMGYGPKMSLQREYILLIPLGLATLITLSPSKTNRGLKNACTGILIGMGVMIKPNAVIVLPLFLWYQMFEIRSHSDRRILDISNIITLATTTLAGFILPLLAGIVYLLQKGAFSNFIDIACNYWGLYSSLDTDHSTIHATHRLRYLLSNYLTFGYHRVWFIPAITGTYYSLCHSPLKDTQRRGIWLLVGLALCFSLYPVLSGQFWDYHWLPFAYFMVLLASLCFTKSSAPIFRFISLLIVIAVALYTSHGDRLFKPYFRFAQEVPKQGRPDRIARFLKENMRPGDTVQPLDWARGGAVHGMLMAEARIATPFIYYFHFFHHVSSPYIQNLRTRFLKSMNKTRPRFVIEIIPESPWVSGPDTTQHFREMEEFLARYYLVRVRGRGYLIHELKEP